MLVRRRTNQLSGIERSGFEPGHFEELRSFFDWFFDSFLEPFGGLLERSLSRLEASWRGLEAQGGPRALQETSRRPKDRSKRPQGGPKSAPGGLKTAPRARQEAPRALQEASRRLQEAPSRLQERSKRPQERFKRPSSPLQRLLTLKWLRPQFSRVFSSILEPGDVSGSSPDGSRRLEEAFRRLCRSSRGFPVASSGLESAPKRPRSE